MKLFNKKRPNEICIFNKFYKITYTGIIRGVTKLQDNNLYLYGIETNVSKKIFNFCEIILQKQIVSFVQHYNKIYNTQTRSIKIKNLKSKWGSCNHNKDLVFNLKLIHFPIEIVEYVVVHEVCHQIEMNHSKNFWLLVEKSIPNYKSVRTYIKKNTTNIISLSKVFDN